MDLKKLQEGIKEGQVRALAKGITLVESTLSAHKNQAEELLTQLMPFTGGALKIGISGIPGVGKSTFIEAFGTFLLKENPNRRLAVLAVDPSSPIHGGAILGDKTRMEELSVHPRAFIRPSPGGGAVGGISRRARESILLMEACGYDTIFVETIGVGQSETLVASMVDVFLMLQMPNMGDELQGMKKGILELADIIAINKADGSLKEAAQRSKIEHEQALRFTSVDCSPTPVVLLSAKNKEGLSHIWTGLKNFVEHQKNNGSFEQKRQNQVVQWFERELGEQIQAIAADHKAYEGLFKEFESKVRQRELAPSVAARTFIKKILKVS
ncbi:MAG: methylmalonyl Co-A mutase-associated GTPase MeaB [Oligoflexales bacterium]